MKLTRKMLETTCLDCGGGGWVIGNEFRGFIPAKPADAKSQRCHCVGGSVPSELGETILEFVRDYLEAWVLEKSRDHTHGRGER